MWTWMSAYRRKSNWVFCFYFNKNLPILIFQFLIESNTLWSFLQHLLFKFHKSLELFVLGLCQKTQSWSLHRSVSYDPFDLTFLILIYKLSLSLLFRKYFLFFPCVHLKGLFFVPLNCLIVSFWLLLEFVSVAKSWSE